MKFLAELVYLCRVLTPWNERTTLVEVEDISHFEIIIPTDTLPPDLRRIVSRFQVVIGRIRPEEGDAAEEYREALLESFGIRRLA